MRAIAPVLLAIATLAAIACAFREAKQTPDIDATVEARVRGTQEAEAAIEATVQVRVAATLTAPYPAATPYPTATPHPTSTPYPTLTPEQEERFISLLYMCFQSPGFAELVAEEVGLPKELIAPLYEDWELFRAMMLLALQEDPSFAADFPEMEAMVSVICADEGAVDGQIQDLQATIGLRGYADQHAGGPGAIYIGDGDLSALAGPSVYPDFMYTYGTDLGDDYSYVPMYAIEQHQWIFESDYYRSLLARARLTNPTQLVSSGRRIELHHACINRQLLWCKHLQAYFVPNVQERTEGQVRINITSFPELGLAGTDTASLLADGTLSMTEIYGGYVGGEFPTLAVQYIWGLWPDHETHYRVLTNIAPDLDKVYEDELGAQVLMRNWIAGDDQFFFSNKRLENPEDFVGLKTRSHSAELSDWINTWARPRSLWPSPRCTPPWSAASWTLA